MMRFSSACVTETAVAVKLRISVWRQRCRHDRVVAGQLFAVGRLNGHSVLRAGHEAGEREAGLCLKALVELVPVGVGADNLERAVLFGGIDLHGQMIRARIKKGYVVNVDVAGRDDEEVDRRADARDQKQAAKRNGSQRLFFLRFLGGEPESSSGASSSSSGSKEPAMP